MSLFKALAAAAFAATLALLPLSSQAQVNITGGGGDKNPTVLFKGVAGNPQVSSQIDRDLKMCGWFEVVSSGSSEYVISGTANGNAIALNLANAAGVAMQTVNASGDNPTMASHRAVDGILKYLFKIEGICRTKICFSAQVAPGKKEIYMCDFDGSNFQKVTNDNMLAIEPVWSPKGSSIIYCALGGGAANLIETNIADKRSRRLAQFPGYNGGGRISPNGATVALILSKDNQLDLYTRGVNSSDLRRLTNDKGVEASPCWSPDGSKICFVSDAGVVGRPKLFIMSAGGGGLKQVPGLLGSESVTPSWSKDNRIAYSAKVGSYALAVADLGSSSHMKGIIAQDGDWKSPSWAPDNRHVVCEHGGELWVVDTWLGKKRMLVNGKSRVVGPDWSDILY